MRYAVISILALMFSGVAFPESASKKAKTNDPTELKGYVEDANRRKVDAGSTEGSLWTGTGYRSNLFRDSKARSVDDVVTIRVSESTQAIASADAKNSRNSSMTAGFDHLFGAEKVIKELPTMLSGQGKSSFDGTGSTSRETTLQTNLTARVVGVLPNGYLVVEGMRQVRVNNESQNVYLTGIVRPEDISQNNVVLSSSVAQMSVRVEGKGFVSQPLKPGWLYKILIGILPF